MKQEADGYSAMQGERDHENRSLQGGSEEGYCYNKRDSCEYPGGMRRDSGEGSGVGVGEGEDGMCRDGVMGRGVGGYEEDGCQ